MFPEDLHRFVDGTLDGLETREPLVEVYVEVTAHVDGLLGDPAFQHEPDHLVTAYVLRTAIRVTYDHDILHTEFVYPDKDTADGRGEG